MGNYQFTKHFYIRPLSEPLICLLVCIPFWLFRDSIPDNLWGKGVFLIGGIPLLFIWLVDRIYKVVKQPKVFVFDLNSNILVIDQTNYSINDLKWFYISGKQGAFKMEFEFPDSKKFEAGEHLKTLAMYKVNSSLDEFSDSIKTFKNIKTFTSN